MGTASKLGTVLPCINWLGRPIPSFAVTLGFDLPSAPTNVSLASGGAVKVAGGATSNPLVFENNTFFYNQVRGVYALEHHMTRLPLPTSPSCHPF